MNPSSDGVVVVDGRRHQRNKTLTFAKWRDFLNYMYTMYFFGDDNGHTQSQVKRAILAIDGYHPVSVEDYHGYHPLS